MSTVFLVQAGHQSVMSESASLAQYELRVYTLVLSCAKLAIEILSESQGPWRRYEPLSSLLDPDIRPTDQ